jgi:hypothetical protein
MANSRSNQLLAKPSLFSFVFCELSNSILDNKYQFSIWLFPNLAEHYYPQIDRTFRDEYRARISHRISSETQLTGSVNTGGHLIDHYRRFTNRERL